MSSAEGRTTGRPAADVSLLNQLVLEVYLAAWTRTGVKDEQTLRTAAASADDVDDGDPGVIDLDHFFDVTDLPPRPGRRRDSHQFRPRTSMERSGRTCLHCEHVGSVCYTSGPSLVHQSASSWKGGSDVGF